MKFVTLINFTDQGFSDISQTTGRAAAFIEHAKQSGVEVSELLWLTGRWDGLMVFDAADIETASAVMLALSTTGNVRTETMPAFDAAGMNQILQKL